MHHRLILSALLLAAWLTGAPPPARAAHVNLIELDNQVINPVTQQYLVEAVRRSETDGAECLVVLLDTPGGLLDSTRAIVKTIMNARVPVVVYVAPSGARAGSAGVFITLAAHVAAMAPSTNIGAAHPVGVGDGGPVKKLIRRFKRLEEDQKKKRPADSEEEIVEEEERSPMDEKVINDTVAWVTTIARTRGRNEVWAARAVRESISATEAEAVKEHVVDFIAPDVPALLQRLDGRTVELIGDQTRQLRTVQASVVTIPLTPRQRFLATITNPSIAYLLMMLGTFGLIFEFTHPGIGFPGIAGLICVILAMYAFQTLPINYAGLALMGLGLILLIAEVMVTSYGLLTLGAVIALTLGSLLLIDSPLPALQISLRVILPTVIGISGLAVLLAQRALRAQRQRVTTGAQGLIGETGTAATDLKPRGRVEVHGESWNAVATASIRKGARITVTRVTGLELTVKPAPHQ